MTIIDDGRMLVRPRGRLGPACVTVAPLAIGLLAACAFGVLGMAFAGTDGGAPAAQPEAGGIPAAAAPPRQAEPGLSGLSLAALSRTPTREVSPLWPAADTTVLPPPPPPRATPEAPVDVVLPPRRTRAEVATSLSAVAHASAAPPMAAALSTRLASLGYDLVAVRETAGRVPRFYLDSLPRDLDRMSSIEARKTLFIKIVLPIVLRVNEELAAARLRVEWLFDRLALSGAIAPVDRRWLEEIAERCETDPFDREALLSRLDVVPPSLALAQAAEETGWGTSRFAREGNALFGMYTYEAALGMLPKRRDAHRRHRVRSFPSLFEAGSAYARNLNCHPAYAEFRQARVALRAAGVPMSGYALAGELTRYSERGTAYIRTIRRIIRQNNLDDFDRVHLRDRARRTASVDTPMPRS